MGHEIHNFKVQKLMLWNMTCFATKGVEAVFLDILNLLFLLKDLYCSYFPIFNYPH